MKKVETITITQVLSLFKKYLSVEITRTSLYHYIKKHKFPKPIKPLRPSRWRKDLVMLWIKEQIAASES